MKTNSLSLISLRVRRLLIMTVLILGTILLSACSSKANNKSDTIKLAPINSLPVEIRNAPVVVRESYQFALANPDALKNVPCYCGCGNVGHTSNYDCYIKDIKQSGEIIFDQHALGCSICVDISQDVIKMSENGKSPADIRTSIDLTYSQYGPSNMPPAE
jgi:hypothetical protein